MLELKPLRANVEYTPHYGDISCSGCSASYRQKDQSKGLGI